MKTNKLIILSLLMLFAFCIYSCSNDSVDDFVPDNIDTSGGSGDGTSITYNGNVKSIMQSSCVSCHSSPPVNGAPFSLINFNQVSQRANSILTVMNKQSGTANAMPPSGRLPQSTIDVIQQWIANGKQEN
jgi:cytochrome c5